MYADVHEAPNGRIETAGLGVRGAKGSFAAMGTASIVCPAVMYCIVW